MQRGIHRHAHGQRAGVPSTGDQPAPAAFRRALRVGVEPLRIELAGKLQDLGFRDGDRTGLDQHAVFEFSELHLFFSPEKTDGALKARRAFHGWHACE
ncbi:hypothetical protein D3C73_1483930 [compost metagenome]